MRYLDQAGEPADTTPGMAVKPAAMPGEAPAEVRRRFLRRARFRAALLYWLLIPAAVIGSGLLLDRVLPSWRPDGWLMFPGILLLVAGCALVQKATIDLSRYGDGTPAPQDPARRLVTAGSYAWCRHPMFLGYDLAAWGVGLLLVSPGMLLVSLPVMLLWQWFFLRREERLLAKRFADSWPGYRQRVPLLLPWLPNKKEPS
jgi:protein-S-isoprenylcysteine O-methyltransferase Ste14